MRRLITPVFWLIASVALFACSSTGNTTLPAAPAIPAPVVGSSSTVSPVQGVVYQWDVSTLQSQRIGPPGAAYTELVVSGAFVQFSGPNAGQPDDTAFPSLPPAGSTCTLTTQLCGQIEIDIDNNPATGALVGYCGVNGTWPGVDYTVDLGTISPINADGTAEIFSNATGFEATPVGEATITGGAGGSVVNVFIPISLIGGASGGPFNVGSAFGNVAGPTVCAASNGYIPDVKHPGPPSNSWKNH
ncbi:MAG TPA: hypothetical protein VKF82_04495 [Candidatus Eremiobacteraceae bacterium]|nr:hypothetical protein [Candidatus Eremiobacteraceae bacterium]